MGETSCSREDMKTDTERLAEIRAAVRVWLAAKTRRQAEAALEEIKLLMKR